MDWNLVVQDLGPRLYRFFTMRYHDNSAADLVQEVLSRLYVKVSGGNFDPEVASLTSFAFGIAMNVQRESLRDRSKWNYEELNPDHYSPEQQADSQEIRKIALRKAIERLNSMEQQVLQLLLDRDLSLDEISKILNIPLNTVKSHISRAKHKLRKILNDQETSS
ncbi:MAG: sigma-70 family RNA polymerase sigma factor [Deltaproteobacteria bacterium]|nr:sigma-70 family RNA polymerase sigma factor [Deltaproteobacteria bacterium]